MSKHHGVSRSPDCPQILVKVEVDVLNKIWKNPVLGLILLFNLAKHAAAVTGLYAVTLSFCHPYFWLIKFA